MPENNNHINYSAADIERYHQGALSAAEMHDMEKAALDDAFLADAMEGYENRRLAPGMPDARAGISNDLEELEKRLAIRTGEKKKAAIIKFPWWKAAAIVVLFIGAGWLYMTINGKAKPENIAGNGQPVEKTIPPVPLTKDSSAELQRRADTTEVAGVLATREKKALPILRNYAPVNKPLTPQEKSLPAPVASEPMVAKNEETEKALSKKISSAKTAPAQTAPARDSMQTLTAGSPAADKDFMDDPGKKKTLVDMRLEQKAAGLAANNERSSATTLSNTFNGMVVDRLHRPVANATVQIPNLNIVTVTDNKGFFSFAAPDTVLSVSIASVGFETQQLSLHNNETLNQITLKPDSKALNEVAVNGYGVTRKKEASSKAKHVTITILGAEPVVSWIKYNDYLDQNKRIPADAKDFHGETVVAFTVDNKNTLKNFRIERSINEQLDAEAIRLVKEGPPWRLLKGKKATVSVIVKF